MNDEDYWEVERTPRGFQIIQFKDHYGENCSLQQSSAWIYDEAEPGQSAIWLGVDKDDQHYRMHLTVEQVEILMRHLESWVNTGSLDPFERW